MKILFIFTNYHLAHITAQPGIALKLAHKAADTGHDVTVLANTDGELLQKNGKIKLVLYKGLGDLSSFIRSFGIIVRTISTVQPDVIHIHGHLLFLMISFINIFFRKPITFFSSETINILTPWQKKLFVPALSQTKQIFVTSKFIQQEFVADGVQAKKISLAHIGIADRFYKEPPKPKEDIDILFFGDSKYDRGFDRVEALVKLLPEYSFQILLRWSTAEQLKKIKKSPNVTVLHHPYKIPLENFILRSKLILLPFRDMGVRPPVSILEAMLLGKTVITSWMGGNEEVIMDNKSGILDEFKDFHSLKLRLVKVLKDAKQRELIGTTARQEMLRLYAQKNYQDVVKIITV